MTMDQHDEQPKSATDADATNAGPDREGTKEDVRTTPGTTQKKIDTPDTIRDGQKK